MKRLIVTEHARDRLLERNFMREETLRRIWPRVLREGVYGNAGVDKLSRPMVVITHEGVRYILNRSTSVDVLVTVGITGDRRRRLRLGI